MMVTRRKWPAHRSQASQQVATPASAVRANR